MVVAKDLLKLMEGREPAFEENLWHIGGREQHFRDAYEAQSLPESGRCRASRLTARNSWLKGGGPNIGPDSPDIVK